MENSKFKIGQEVVRSKGDYVVGMVGLITAIDEPKRRAKVDCEVKAWISFDSLELTSEPYEIIPSYRNDKNVFVNPKYKKLSHA